MYEKILDYFDSCPAELDRQSVKCLLVSHREPWKAAASF